MKKNNKLISLFFAVLFLNCTLTAQNIEKIYVSMPDVYNPLLTQMQRFELLEYFKANLNDSVINKHGSKSFLIELDSINHYVKVQNTDISQMELKLIPNKKAYSILMVNTVCSDICQSYIKFFDQNWEEKKADFTLPIAKDWLDYEKLSQEKKEMQDYISNMLNISFVKVNLIADENNLIVENKSIEFLSEEEKNIVEPFLIKTPLIYHFNGKKWIRL